MNKFKITLLVLMVALLIPTTLVSAKEMGALEISGPGISGTLRIDHPDQIGPIEGSGFFDQSAYVRLTEEEIAALGEGYEITFYIRGGEEGEYVHREMLVYYPNPNGEEAYAHWIGGGSMELDIVPSSRWNRVRQGEDVFWSVMEIHGVTRPVAETAAVELSTKQQAPAVQEAAVSEQPAAQVSQQISEQPANTLMLGIGAAALALIAGIAGVLVLRKRQQPHAESAAASD